MDKIFWTDSDNNITYQQLIEDINSKLYGANYVWEDSAYQVFLHILHSIINDYPVTLLDGDFTENEIVKNGIDLVEVKKRFKANRKINSYHEIIDKTSNLKRWSLNLLTSGTTGLPKKVQHTFTTISKAVKISAEHKNDVWGFAYNPTHMAGIQVFLQAFMNKNQLIEINGNKPNEIIKKIEDNRITHISATPTFYRLFLNPDINFPFVKQISSGGEKMSDSLKQDLKNCFPNAKIRNIYASTEAGSLFASDGENFKISNKYKDKIKIVNNEIVLHSSLLGKSKSLHLVDDWYCTGDMVEIVAKEPNLIFRFISRKNEMINVGGFKVNPHEVEEALLQIPQIKKAKVFGKSNPVLGQLLCANVVATGITEKSIRAELNLQKYKIPRIINFVKDIELTRTGKVKR